jgi:hypothetical protein
MAEPASSMKAFIEDLKDSRFSVLMEAIGALTTTEFAALTHQDVALLFPSPASAALAIVLVKSVQASRYTPLPPLPQYDVRVWQPVRKALLLQNDQRVPGKDLTLDQFFDSCYEGVVLVDLLGCRMRDKDVPVVLRHLERRPCLRVLNVACNRLSVNGIRALLPLVDKDTFKALVTYGNKVTRPKILDMPEMTPARASKIVLISAGHTKVLKGNKPYVEEVARNYYNVTLPDTLHEYGPETLRLLA